MSHQRTATGAITTPVITPVGVLPEAFERPQTPPNSATPGRAEVVVTAAAVRGAQARSLPFTGSATDQLLITGLSLLMLGVALAMVPARRARAQR